MRATNAHLKTATAVVSDTRLPYLHRQMQSIARKGSPITFRGSFIGRVRAGMPHYCRSVRCPRHGPDSSPQNVAIAIPLGLIFL